MKLNEMKAKRKNARAKRNIATVLRVKFRKNEKKIRLYLRYKYTNINKIKKKVIQLFALLILFNPSDFISFVLKMKKIAASLCTFWGSNCKSCGSEKSSATR
jgi:hypothetical protein